MITITEAECPPGSLGAHIFRRQRETQSKQVPDFYIFENAPNQDQGGKPVGAVFQHTSGEGFTIVIAGRRYVAFRPKAKAKMPETEGEP